MFFITGSLMILKGLNVSDASKRLYSCISNSFHDWRLAEEANAPMTTLNDPPPRLLGIHFPATFDHVASNVVESALFCSDAGKIIEPVINAPLFL